MFFRFVPPYTDSVQIASFCTFLHDSISISRPYRRFVTSGYEKRAAFSLLLKTSILYPVAPLRSAFLISHLINSVLDRSHFAKLLPLRSQSANVEPVIEDAEKLNLEKYISENVLYLSVQSEILCNTFPIRPADLNKLQLIPTRTQSLNSRNLTSEYSNFRSEIVHPSNTHSERLYRRILQFSKEQFKNLQSTNS